LLADERPAGGCTGEGADGGWERPDCGAASIRVGGSGASIRVGGSGGSERVGGSAACIPAGGGPSIRVGGIASGNGTSTCHGVS
jgi:hypothetical protein